MVISCCAYACTNRWGKLKEDGTKLQFHLFPHRKPDLLKKWIVAVRRAAWEPSKSSVLCGDHFDETAYKSSARRYLKDDAVPSIFSFSSHLRKTKRELAPSCESIQHPLANSQNQSFAISSSLKIEAITRLMSRGNDERNKGTKFKGTQTELSSSDILNQNLELKRLQTALLRTLGDNGSPRKKCKGTQTKLTSSDILNEELELKQLRDFYESDALLRNVTKMQALYNKGLANKQIEFTLNQISNFERKNPRWSDSVLRECVFLHATSPECYEALRDRELLKLPTRRTLSNFLKPTSANNSEEFCDAIFELPATTDDDELSDTNFEPTTATDQDELSDSNFEPTTITDEM